MADPFQRYRGLEIAADSPRPGELARVAHHGVGDLALTERSSAAGFAALAHRAIDAALAAGRVPIVTGGTGLYLRAALADLDFPDAADPAVRRWAEELASRDPAAALAELRARDPERAARVDAANPRRVARALEVAAGGPAAAGDALWSAPLRHPALMIGLSRPREELDRRIALRVRRELDDGLVAELEAALDTPGVSREALQVIGAREVAAIRAGALAPEDLPERLAARTRRLARKQLTWLRKMPGIAWLDLGDAPAEEALDAAARAVAGRRGRSGTLRRMRFAKWQGTGNHHLVVESAGWPLPITPARARRILDPAFGVGGDGILELTDDGGTPRMTVWNPDGSQAENCGNGIRIVARYLEADGRLPADGRILTGDGPVPVRTLDDGRVAVSMGRARFPAGEGREVLRVNGSAVELAEVSMGNPHAVIEHPAPDEVVRALGPQIEVDPRFPQRTNVEFVRAEGPSELTMRVWERGVGETLACGTGACAAAVAGVRLGGLTSPVTVHLIGGDLEIAVDDDLEVTMTGPAEEIYRGELSPELVRALEEL